MRLLWGHTSGHGYARFNSAFLANFRVRYESPLSLTELNGNHTVGWIAALSDQVSNPDAGECGPLLTMTGCSPIPVA